MTSSPINVLFIEDSPGDASLLIEELGKADSGTVFQCIWVDNLEKGFESLTANDISVVKRNGSFTFGAARYCTISVK